MRNIITIKQLSDDHNICIYPAINNGINFGNLPDGPYEEHGSKGNLTLRGTLKGGHLDSTLELFDPQIWYSDPKLPVFSCHIKDGVLDGPWEIIYHDGVSGYNGYKISGNCEKGIVKGAYTIRDRDNKIVLSGTRSNKLETRYDGTTFLRSFWTGEFFTPGLHCFYDEEGRLDGPYESKYKKANYKKGKLHGNFEETGFEDITKCTYDEGQIVGDYEKIDIKTGRTYLKCHYKKDKENPRAERGILDGHYQKFYSNTGECYFDLSYKDGILDGKCIDKNRETIFKKGELLQYTYIGGDGKRHEIPGNKTDFQWRYFFAPDHGLQPELLCRCTNLKELYLDNSTEDRGGNWCLSDRKIPQKVWDGIAQNTDLEEVKLQFMDVDYKALSHLKKLKRLTITNEGMYGNSGFSVSDANIAALGELPELESLSIDVSQISADGLKMIKKQFPKLKELNLKTKKRVILSKEELLDAKEKEIESQEYRVKYYGMKPQFSNFITISDLAKDFANVEISINGLGSGTLRKEAEKVEIANSPDFEDRFKELIKEKQYKKALEVLHIKGLIPNLTKHINEGSKWSSNYYYSRDDYYQGSEIKELKDGHYAILLNRERSRFSSGDGGETTYDPYSNLMILDLSEGVVYDRSIGRLLRQGWGLGQAIEGFDGEKAVYSKTPSLDNIALPENIPQRKDLRARLRTATEPEDKKSIAKLLAKGSYKREAEAREIKISRRKRDLENSSLTIRAYQAKKTSTK